MQVNITNSFVLFDHVYILAYEEIHAEFDVWLIFIFRRSRDLESRSRSEPEMIVKNLKGIIITQNLENISLK